MRNTPVTRITILEEIGDHLQQVMQWSRHQSFDSCAKYQAKAEALIEVLEVHDCGSVGGYDDGYNNPRTLFGRFDWLYRKYHKPDGVTFSCCDVTYEEMCEFFDFVPKHKQAA